MPPGSRPSCNLTPRWPRPIRPRRLSCQWRTSATRFEPTNHRGRPPLPPTVAHKTAALSASHPVPPAEPLRTGPGGWTWRRRNWTAEQDLIIRVSQAYFDVLAATDTLTFVQAGRRPPWPSSWPPPSATSRSALSTITDSREAQARYDLVIAQEIAANNDLRVKSSWRWTSWSGRERTSPNQSGSTSGTAWRNSRRHEPMGRNSRSRQSGRTQQAPWHWRWRLETAQGPGRSQAHTRLDGQLFGHHNNGTSSSAGR